MPCARQKKQIRCRKQGMKTFCDAPVQVGIGVSENDPDRALEFPKLLHLSGTCSDRGRQVLIQAKECRARAGGRLKLLVEERQKFIPCLRVPEKPSDLPPEHLAEDKVAEHL